MPEIGDTVWFRGFSGLEPALVANVHKNGNLTLAVLGRSGQWYTRDHVQRAPIVDDGSIEAQGMWRMMKK